MEVEDQEQDIFIPENDTGSAMHQDKVQILVRNGHKEGKRQEGVVLKVLERECLRSWEHTRAAVIMAL